MRLKIGWGRHARLEAHGRALLGRGEFEAAAEWSEHLLDSSRGDRLERVARPLGLEAYLELGLARFHSGADGAAEAAFARALQIDPQEPRARYYRARVFQRSGRCREAIADLGLALEADPRDGDACMLLAVCLGEVGEESRASMALDRALALAQREAGGASRSRSSHEVASRKRPRAECMALEAVTRAIRERPCYPDLRYRKALLLVRERRMLEAEVELERALRINPRYLEARLLATRMRIVFGNPDGAGRQIESMLELHPDYPDLHFWLGVARFHAGAAELALGPLERAVSLNRHFARAQRLLGLLHHRLARTALALRCLRRGLVRDRELDAPTLASGRTPVAAVGAEDPEIERRVALQPHYPDLHLALASKRRAGGALEEARDACRRALALHPAYDAAALEMARLEIALGRPERAQILLAGLVRRHPLWADAHALLGSALKARGNRWDAEPALRQALRLNPDYAEARRDLAWALDSGAETSGARRE